RELIVSRNKDIIEYLDEAEHNLLRELEVEIIYPLKVMNHISGTLLVGEKCDGTRFSKEEILLLSLLFD
ncbi:MAG: histidine kinase, partial [Rikenellaceae bacterium]|nr:histidine kinase [Rikenellaceae bacterium]